MYHPRNLNPATLHRQKNVDKKDMKQRIGRLLSTLLLTTFSLGTTAGVIKGTIIDKQTKEPLTGATVQVTGSATGAVADLNGNYTLTLNNGTYTSK